MNNMRLGMPTIFILLVLGACSSPPQEPIIAPIELKPEPIVSDNATMELEYTREVAYRCGDDKELMRVQYGLNGNEVLVAQVHFRGRLTPILYKQASKKLTKFTNAGVTWLVEPLTLKNLYLANGKSLMQQEKIRSGNSFTWVNVLVADKCLIDDKITARLNKQ